MSTTPSDSNVAYELLMTEDKVDNDINVQSNEHTDQDIK